MSFGASFEAHEHVITLMADRDYPLSKLGSLTQKQKKEVRTQERVAVFAILMPLLYQEHKAEMSIQNGFIMEDPQMIDTSANIQSDLAKAYMASNLAANPNEAKKMAINFFRSAHQLAKIGLGENPPNDYQIACMEYDRGAKAYEEKRQKTIARYQKDLSDAFNTPPVNIAIGGILDKWTAKQSELSNADSALVNELKDKLPSLITRSKSVKAAYNMVFEDAASILAGGLTDKVFGEEWDYVEQELRKALTSRIEKSFEDRLPPTMMIDLVTGLRGKAIDSIHAVAKAHNIPESSYLAPSKGREI